MSSWTTSKRQRVDTDPLKLYQRQPVITQGQPPGRNYVGRVIIELWGGATEADDAYGLALRIGAVDGSDSALLRRLDAALPKRAASQEPGWLAISSTRSDSGLLKNYWRQPLITRGQEPTGRSYVGRLIGELWAGATAADDSNGLALSVEAIDGNDGALLRRVAAALPKRLASQQLPK